MIVEMQRKAATAQKNPISASTNGYRHPIQTPHVLQRPRSASQLTTGTFSHQASVRAQLRQCERGLTTLSPSGHRLRQTFRKLPKASPRSPARTAPRMRIMKRSPGRSSIRPAGARTSILKLPLAQPSVRRKNECRHSAWTSVHHQALSCSYEVVVS